MTEYLLVDTDKPNSKDHDLEYEHIDDESKTIFFHLHSMVIFAVPMIFTCLMSMGSSFILFIFAGKFGQDQQESTVIFSAISLSNLLYVVTFISVIHGLASAVETLASHANGLRKYDQVGLAFQRSLLIISALLVPFLPVAYLAGPILEKIGIEAEVARLAAKYLHIRLFCLPGDVFTIAYQRYLVAIGVPRPTAVHSTVLNILIFLMDYLALHLKLSETTLLINISVSTYLSGLCMYRLSLSYQEVQMTNIPWDSRSLQHWMDFLRLGFPGMMITCSEWWAYEFLTIMAGKLGKEELSAQSIIMQSVSILFMIPMALGTVTCSMVGNSIGQRNIPLAKTLSKIAIALGLAACTVEVFALSLTGGHFIKLYSNDPKVQDVVTSAIPFLCLFICLDGTQVVINGILRGCGKQKLGAVIGIISFYGVGLPMAYFFCFHLHMEVSGLMKGISLGTAVQVTSLALIFICGNHWLYAQETDQDHHQDVL